MAMSMQQKVTIITGAGSGIGRASALRFARAGARVALFGRTRQTLAATAAAIREEDGAEALVVPGDVAREEDVQMLFARVLEVCGRVDILLNCAGVVAVKPFREMDATTWDRVLNTNLRGTFLCCQQAFTAMATEGGVILNISSLSGVKGVEKFPGLSAYNVSKAGIASLTEILAVEGKPLNIRVAAVSPGAVDTDMLRQAAPHLRAGMTPEEMADILLFMADDSGRALSGTNLEIFSNA